MRYLIVFAVIFSGKNLCAQYSSLKIQPLGAFLNSVSLSYEFSLHDKFIFNTEISYLFYNGSSSQSTKAKFKGISLELKPKIHLDSKEKLLRGWYASPVLGYGLLTESINNSANSTNPASVSITNFGALLGYQWILFGESNGLSIDLNAGCHYYFFRKISESAYINNLKGIFPRIGLGIGYAF